jgi:hypothetical protein
MSTNPHRTKLEQQLSGLRETRWRLKQVIAEEAAALRVAGPFNLDTLGARKRAAETRLVAIEREIAELRHELGLPEPGKPVKIRPVAESLAELTASLARQATQAALARIQAPKAAKAAPPVTRSADLQDALQRRGYGNGYITKVLTAES